MLRKINTEMHVYCILFGFHVFILILIKSLWKATRCIIVIHERAFLQHKSQLLFSFAIFPTFQEDTFVAKIKSILWNYITYVFFFDSLSEILVIQTEICLHGLVDRSTRSVTGVGLKLGWAHVRLLRDVRHRGFNPQHWETYVQASVLWKRRHTWNVFTGFSQTLKSPGKWPWSWKTPGILKKWNLSWIVLEFRKNLIDNHKKSLKMIETVFWTQNR